MNLYLKQKVFSWGDKFTVFDDMGNDRYYVYGEVFSFGKKLHITDLGGNELAFIRQKPISFLPKYYISRSGMEIAEVVKEFTLFKQEYTVNGFGWTVRGDFFAHEYEIYAADRMIASVSKKWLTWGDAYEIRIEAGVEEIDALAVILVIDACLANSGRSN